MANKKSEPELTAYERAKRYTVISETETETETVAVLRTYSGATVICHIPKHTPEEEKALSENICRALVRFANPDVDLSQVERMRVIM